MKVGDEDRSRRTEAEDRRQDKRREQARRDNQRNFSEVMDRRNTSGARCGDDERRRRMRESTVRRGDGDRRQRCRAGEGQRPAAGERQRQVESRRCEIGETKTKGRTADGTEQLCRQTRAGGGEGDGDVFGAPLVVGDDANHRPDDEIAKVDRRTGGAAGSQAATESRGPAAVIDEINRRILQAVHVGKDEQARRVVFLDVTLPDRGDVRIRIRREGGGVGVRMRADNDALARSLRQGTDQLRRRGESAGIDFTSIRVVR